jgi:hypothetical protein
MSARGDSDEQLLEELRGLLRITDPTPPEVTEFAKSALGLRRLDADLAELLSDSALETESAAQIRSGGAARRLTFRARDLSIDLEIQPTDSTIRVLGQISPPPVGMTVELQASDGAVAATSEVDALGRFRLELAAGGRVRLRLVSSDPPIETSWLSL